MNIRIEDIQNENLMDCLFWCSCRWMTEYSHKWTFILCIMVEKWVTTVETLWEIAFLNGQREDSVFIDGKVLLVFQAHLSPFYFVEKEYLITGNGIFIVFNLVMTYSAIIGFIFPIFVVNITLKYQIEQTIVKQTWPIYRNSIRYLLDEDRRLSIEM